MNNKGFSLVELVVVVLILAVLSTGIVVGVSYYKTADTTACSKKLVSALEKARLETMSRTEGSVVLKLYFDGAVYRADIYTVNGESSEPVEEIIDSFELADDSMTLKAAKYTDDGITETGLSSIDNATGISIRFDKSSGIYKPDNDGRYFSRIAIQGNGTESVILVKDTGRSYVE